MAEESKNFIEDNGILVLFLAAQKLEKILKAVTKEIVKILTLRHLFQCIEKLITKKKNVILLFCRKYE